MHSCNLSAQETEAEGLWVWSQLLHSDTMSQNKWRGTYQRFCGASCASVLLTIITIKNCEAVTVFAISVRNGSEHKDVNWWPCSKVRVLSRCAWQTPHYSKPSSRENSHDQKTPILFFLEVTFTDHFMGVLFFILISINPLDICILMIKLMIVKIDIILKCNSVELERWLS